MEKIVTMKRFGRLSVGIDGYALLRPTRFEREHYKFTENEVAFYVAYTRMNEEGTRVEYFNPHVLTICNEGFHIDLLPHPQDISVTLYNQEEKPEGDTFNDFRPIDMIAEADE